MGTFWNYMEQGGPVMWPLLAFSVLGLAFTIEALYRLATGRTLRLSRP